MDSPAGRDPRPTSTGLSPAPPRGVADRGWRCRSTVAVRLLSAQPNPTRACTTERSPTETSVTSCNAATSASARRHGHANHPPRASHHREQAGARRRPEGVSPGPAAVQPGSTARAAAGRQAPGRSRLADCNTRGHNSRWRKTRRRSNRRRMRVTSWLLLSEEFTPSGTIPSRVKLPTR